MHVKMNVIAKIRLVVILAQCRNCRYTEIAQRIFKYSDTQMHQSYSG